MADHLAQHLTSVAIFTYLSESDIQIIEKYKNKFDATDEDDFLEKACMYLESKYNFLVDLAEAIEIF